MYMYVYVYIYIYIHTHIRGWDSPDQARIAQLRRPTRPDAIATKYMQVNMRPNMYDLNGE